MISSTKSRKLHHSVRTSCAQSDFFWLNAHNSSNSNELVLKLKLMTPSIICRKKIFYSSLFLLCKPSVFLVHTIFPVQKNGSRRFISKKQRQKSKIRSDTIVLNLIVNILKKKLAQTDAVFPRSLHFSEAEH